jgi:hypothetical protein
MSIVSPKTLTKILLFTMQLAMIARLNLPERGRWPADDACSRTSDSNAVSSATGQSRVEMD